MRMCVALVIMLDLLIRGMDLEAFYTNSGAVPLPMVYEHAWNPYYISLHAISGAWWVQFVLFAFAFFSAAMLFIGYRTRLFTILSWVLMLSLHNRNVLVLQGGDDLLRMTLFWGMFLPWGARYSCDRLLSRKPWQQIQLQSPATLAYLLQVSYVYTGSALLKGPEWHTECTALYYVYSLDQISYSLTAWFYQFPELLSGMTRLAYYFELLLPLFFFAPFKHSFMRFAGVLLVFGFHLFNGITIYIGLFFLIGMVTAIGILPSSAMDVFDESLYGLRKKVRRSFLGWGVTLRRYIYWHKPRYVFSKKITHAQYSLLVFLILYVLYWNISNLDAWTYKMGTSIRPLGYVLRIDQNWGMFAPGVFKDDGWYVYEGITHKGEEINLLDPDRPISYLKPKSVVAMFPSDRWRKYSENMLMAYNGFMRGYFCNYYKRIWNESHPDQKIHSLRIVYMKEFSELGYCVPEPSREVLFECMD